MRYYICKSSSKLLAFCYNREKLFGDIIIISFILKFSISSEISLLHADLQVSVNAGHNTIIMHSYCMFVYQILLYRFRCIILLNAYHSLLSFSFPHIQQ